MRRQRNVGGGQERNGSPQEIGEEIKKKTAIQGIMVACIFKPAKYKKEVKELHMDAPDQIRDLREASIWKMLSLFLLLFSLGTAAFSSFLTLASSIKK